MKKVSHFSWNEDTPAEKMKQFYESNLENQIPYLKKFYHKNYDNDYPNAVYTSSKHYYSKYHLLNAPFQYGRFVYRDDSTTLLTPILDAENLKDWKFIKKLDDSIENRSKDNLMTRIGIFVPSDFVEKHKDYTVEDIVENTVFLSLQFRHHLLTDVAMNKMIIYLKNFSDTANIQCISIWTDVASSPSNTALLRFEELLKFLPTGTPIINFFHEFDDDMNPYLDCLVEKFHYMEGLILDMTTKQETQTIDVEILRKLKNLVFLSTGRIKNYKNFILQISKLPNLKCLYTGMYISNDYCNFCGEAKKKISKENLANTSKNINITCVDYPIFKKSIKCIIDHISPKNDSIYVGLVCIKNVHIFEKYFIKLCDKKECDKEPELADCKCFLKESPFYNF
uniref:DUF362 domain-containing protein n=1 Tax=Parastrongyloides trichosuri TaxID=131310 RepID=A0A0N5A2L4_PARTI